MWPFSSKPKPLPRRTLDGATVKALLELALKGRTRPDFRHFAQKDRMNVVTRQDIERAADKAFKPWRKEAWECEDQARALVHEAQKSAANEGCSWALGTLRSAYASSGELHVFVWCIVATEGRFAGLEVLFYNPTARGWSSVHELNQVDYTLT